MIANAGRELVVYPGNMEKRLQISPGMRAMLDYSKFTGTTRLLILEIEYFFDKS